MLLLLDSYQLAKSFHHRWFARNFTRLVLLLELIKIYLKLVSPIFYQFFIFSPNDSPLKAMKNAFYFIKKALFVLEIFKFL